MPLLFIIIYVSLGIVLLISLINIMTGPFLRKKHEIIEQVLVSVLVPARNEENNIGHCLISLLEQDYKTFEIIVLDDESTDNTSRIVEKYMKKHKQIQLCHGKRLPPGWTGKNWACHQLSLQARGEILIFTDADNRFGERAISNTVGWIQKYHTGMLSAFPQQITGSFIEKLVIPVIDLLLYASLILWLTYYSRFPSLAAANGQWIAFTLDGYKKTGGHQAVREKIVEDVELCRLAKKKEVLLLTLAGTDIIFGRMYQSAGELWNGFSKNLFGLVSNRTLPLFLILGGLSFNYILPYILIFRKMEIILPLTAILLNMILRLLLAIRYRHPVLLSVLLHPLSILAMIMIGLNSFFKTMFGIITWKEREINTRLRKP